MRCATWSAAASGSVAGPIAAPLVDAALMVQEDLVVLQHVEGSWTVTAGVVCFPTHWTIGEKLGLPLARRARARRALRRASCATRSTASTTGSPSTGRCGGATGSSSPTDRAAPAGVPAADCVVPDRDRAATARRCGSAASARRCAGCPRPGAILFTIRVQLAPARRAAGAPRPRRARCSPRSAAGTSRSAATRRPAGRSTRSTRWLGDAHRSGVTIERERGSSSRPCSASAGPRPTRAGDGRAGPSPPSRRGRRPRRDPRVGTPRSANCTRTPRARGAGSHAARDGRWRAGRRRTAPSSIAIAAVDSGARHHVDSFPSGARLAPIFSR